MSTRRQIPRRQTIIRAAGTLSLFILASCSVPHARMPATKLYDPKVCYPLPYATLESLASESPLLDVALKEILATSPPPNPSMGESFLKLAVPDLRGLRCVKLVIPSYKDPIGAWTLSVNRIGFAIPPAGDLEWITNGFWLKSFTPGKNGAVLSPIDERKELLGDPDEVEEEDSDRLGSESTWDPSFNSPAADITLLVRACFRNDPECIKVLVRSLSASDLWKVDDEDGWLLLEDMRLPLYLSAISALESGRLQAAADQFLLLAKLFPLSKCRDEAAELGPLLAEMARRYPDGTPNVKRDSPVHQWLEDLVFERPWGHSQPGGPMYRKEGAFLQLIAADMAAVPGLIKALEDRRPTGVVYSWRDFAPYRCIYRVCDLAAFALAEISGRGITTFHELANDTSKEWITFFARWNQRYAGRPVVDRYIDALKEGAGGSQRWYLAEKIGALGPEGRSAAPLLIRLLDEGEQDFAETLGLIGAVEARDVLEKALVRFTSFGAVRASVSLDQLGFPSGAEWFSARMKDLEPAKYHQDRFAWDDAFEHFWKKKHPEMILLIQAAAIRLRGPDPANWPRGIRPGK